LLNKKERLDRSHVAVIVFQDDIKIVEPVSERGADDLVKAMILALIAEGGTPGWTILQRIEGDHRGKTLRYPDLRARWLAF
jgi:hypothetical protein